MYISPSFEYFLSNWKQIFCDICLSIFVTIFRLKRRIFWSKKYIKKYFWKQMQKQKKVKNSNKHIKNIVEGFHYMHQES
jgi:hypothetical protein